MKAKDTVIQLRVLGKDKEFLKEASSVEGVSLSNFILEAGLNKAKRVISKKEK